MARLLFLAALASGGLRAALAGGTVTANNVTVQTRACQPPHDQYPFCNTSLPLGERVADLITRIAENPNDIPPQLTARHGGGGNPAPASNISRIGLPEWDWGLNCLHGVQSSCVKLKDGTLKCPTSFPNPVALGFTFNDSIAYNMGAVIATETRALWLLGAVEESDWSGRPHIGLDCWSPNININRDPRWGRNQEVPSEDPLVNGNYGAQHTMGLQQGEDPRHVKVAVTLKHWDAYSLEDSDGFTRHNFNAIVSNFSLANTYWPAFRASVQQGGALGVMCSYNAVNGAPTCSHPFLSTVLRDTWGFSGYMTSDTGAVEDIYQSHKYVATEAEAACVAIWNGTTDVCSGYPYHDALLAGVQQGHCPMSAVTAALNRTLTLRFQLGLFDPIEDQPYWNVPADAINTTASQELNWLATKSSMVLLKNDGATLPFTPGKKVAVIGPHSMAQTALAGNYLGQLCPDDQFDCITTPFAAIQAANVGGVTQTSPGCQLTKNDTSGFAAAVTLAQQSDYVVLMLGIDGSIEGESNDRTSIDLPYIQHQLAAVIAAAGKPTVVVLIHGGSVDVSAEDSNPAIGAILETGYPGVLGGNAIAASIYGDNDHLGGKLSYTAYPAAYTSLIEMSEMELDVGPGRGYRYYTGTPVFPFAWGMSLTTFSIQNLSTSMHAAAAGPLRFSTEATGAALRGITAPAVTTSFNVTNTGSTTGDEVVFLFMYPQSLPIQRDAKPADLRNNLIKQLIGYQRVHLAPGQSQIVSFNVSATSFRITEKGTGDLVSTPGAFKLVATNGLGRWNAGARAERLPAAVRDAAEVAMDVVVEGEEHVVEPFPGRPLRT